MTNKTVQLDIVSDVMCPWCIVGYKQLLPALAKFKDVNFEINWQPFELNPNMPNEGQDLREHLHEKYGSTDEQSIENRKRLTKIGDDLGFEFNFTEESTIYNTFLAHQLLHHAKKIGNEQNKPELQTKVKLALFSAYFTEGKNVSDMNVLIEVALACGIEEESVKDVLSHQIHKDEVREIQKKWQQNGISAVPAVVVNMQYLLSGAQPTEAYIDVINKVISE
ncbi:DsbA family oxidoreductase [Marinicellulosiphila megalodicopiae]|uniref:DsbA family oxidoreductase n=1 Tax=Marinicellulosiphila megalodicopiae TaxID=2724896 RepID=UPI003BAECCB4